MFEYSIIYQNKTITLKTYRYVLSATLNLSKGRVNKTFVIVFFFTCGAEFESLIKF